MEKIRDAMLDFEVAADKAGMGGEQAPAHDTAPPEPSDPMDEPPAEEHGDMMPEEDEPEHSAGFSLLGSHRFGGGSPRVKSVEVDVKAPSKMPVGRRR